VGWGAVLRGGLMCGLGCKQEVLTAKFPYSDYLQCGLRML
jgi:hypothetical protein